MIKVRIVSQEALTPVGHRGCIVDSLVTVGSGFDPQTLTRRRTDQVVGLGHLGAWEYVTF